MWTEAVESSSSRARVTGLSLSRVKRVLFVPYALHDRDAYARLARTKFNSLGECVT